MEIFSCFGAEEEGGESKREGGGGGSERLGGVCEAGGILWGGGEWGVGG